VQREEKKRKIKILKTKFHKIKTKINSIQLNLTAAAAV
jgi:hypothetical protein